MSTWNGSWYLPKLHIQLTTHHSKKDTLRSHSQLWSVIHFQCQPNPSSSKITPTFLQFFNNNKYLNSFLANTIAVFDSISSLINLHYFMIINLMLPPTPVEETLFIDISTSSVSECVQYNCKSSWNTNH